MRSPRIAIAGRKALLATLLARVEGAVISEYLVIVQTEAPNTATHQFRIRR